MSMSELDVTDLTDPRTCPCAVCRDPFEGLEILVLEGPRSSKEPDGLSHLYCYLRAYANGRKERREFALALASLRELNPAETARMERIKALMDAFDGQDDLMAMVALVKTDPDVRFVWLDQHERAKIRRGVSQATTHHTPNVLGKCPDCSRPILPGDPVLTTAPPGWKRPDNAPSVLPRTRHDAPENPLDEGCTTRHFVCALNSRHEWQPVGAGVRSDSPDKRSISPKILRVLQQVLALMDEPNPWETLRKRPRVVKQRYPELFRVLNGQARRAGVRWRY